MAPTVNLQEPPCKQAPAMESPETMGVQTAGFWLLRTTKDTGLPTFGSTSRSPCSTWSTGDWKVVPVLDETTETEPSLQAASLQSWVQPGPPSQSSPSSTLPLPQSGMQVQQSSLEQPPSAQEPA